ncbi:MAG: hypothetical protein CMI56_02965 [Parcubacteria group bacterium]|nr:hypothetical protein [Parcubacteria group bacterium]
MIGKENNNALNKSANERDFFMSEKSEYDKILNKKVADGKARCKPFVQARRKKTSSRQSLQERKPYSRPSALSRAIAKVKEQNAKKMGRGKTRGKKKKKQEERKLPVLKERRRNMKPLKKTRRNSEKVRKKSTELKNEKKQLKKKEKIVSPSGRLENPAIISTPNSGVGLAPFMDQAVPLRVEVSPKQASVSPVTIGGEWKRALEYKISLESTVEKLTAELDIANAKIAEAGKCAAQNTLCRFALQTQVKHLEREVSSLHCVIEKRNSELQSSIETAEKQSLAIQRSLDREGALDKRIECLEEELKESRGEIYELEEICSKADDEMTRMQELYDTQAKELDKISDELSREKDISKKLRKAKAGKDTHVHLLVKEKERLHCRLERVERKLASRNTKRRLRGHSSKSPSSHTSPKGSAKKISNCLDFSSEDVPAFSPSAASPRSNCQSDVSQKTKCHSHVKSGDWANTPQSNSLTRSKEGSPGDCDSSIRRTIQNPWLTSPFNATVFIEEHKRKKENEKRSETPITSEMQNTPGSLSACSGLPRIVDNIDLNDGATMRRLRNKVTKAVTSQKAASDEIKKLKREKQEILVRFREASRRAQTAEARTAERKQFQLERWKK